MAASSKRKGSHRLFTISLRLLIWLMVLAILIEGAAMLLICLASLREADGLTIIYADENGRGMQGVSLYESGRTPVVNDMFFELLAGLHKSGANAVRIPLDAAQHLRGDALDEGWMGQAAVMLEMIYQSGHQVILSIAPPQDRKLSATEYEELWRQIDAMWGHRSARELLYEFVIPDGAQERWLEAIGAIVSGVREREERRMVVLTTTAQVLAEEQEALSGLVERISPYIGLNVQGDMREEEWFAARSLLGSSGRQIILIVPEEDGEKAADLAKGMASEHGTGLMLYGN